MRRCFLILLVFFVLSTSFAFANNGAQQIKIQQPSQPPIIISIGSPPAQASSVTSSKNEESTYHQQRTNDFKAEQLRKLKARFERLEKDIENNNKLQRLNKKSFDQLISLVTFVITLFAAGAAFAFFNLFEKAKVESEKMKIFYADEMNSVHEQFSKQAQEQAEKIEQANTSALEEFENKVNSEYERLFDEFEHKYQTTLHEIEERGKNTLIQLEKRGELEFITLQEKMRTSLKASEEFLAKYADEVAETKEMLSELQNNKGQFTPEQLKILDEISHSETLPANLRTQSQLIRAFKNSDWKEALEIAEQLLEAAPTPSIHYYAAASAFNIGVNLHNPQNRIPYFEKSIAFCKSALARYGTLSWEIYLNWANVYRAQAELVIKSNEQKELILKEALKLLATAIEQQGSNIFIGIEQARILESLGKLPTDNAKDFITKSDNLFEQLISENPDSYIPLARYGNSLLIRTKIKDCETEEYQKNINKACEVLLNAENLEEGSGSYDLACIASRNNDMDECKKWLETYFANKFFELPADYIINDTDLANVHQEPWFNELIELAFKNKEQNAA
ncbi:hypothetical protein [Halodesulfovibrio marinisediminis]|uniref:Tetratricopeptide repeat-containing protein n=1 Tax=Halodesulfovibrio marinisediminis DSM 17456 TaxID=1121457 RepID=A0A1N6HZT6_9BACT|nr:hypothetical protein [Halodesulfovibrio marinisediminis]SIO25313.1 hypothetical protein SAMN02745161_2309 [Halodesulfovibrio marinisediminis DSM 17456]